MNLASRRKQSVYRFVVLTFVLCLTRSDGLSIRTSREFGNLQVLSGKTWKYLVTGSLDTATVKVFCRTLGLPTDDVTRYDGNDLPVKARDVLPVTFDCDGSEESIADCETSVRRSLHIDDELVYLRCNGLSFTLHGGGQTEGLVGVSKRNKTYPVCVDTVYDGLVAKRICQDLWISSSYPLVVNPYQFTNIDRWKALQLEAPCSLNTSDCDIHTSNNEGFCNYGHGTATSDLLAIYCNDQALVYRLTTPAGESVGRLEVMINSTWGPVCSSTDGDFAEKVCQEMGLPSTDARYYTGLYSGGEFDPKALTLNSCYMDESGLCLISMVGKRCDGDKYQALSCGNATEGQIRLVGGSVSPSTGTAQVYHHGTWLSIGIGPSKSSALKVATVICRSLNFSTNGVDVNRGYSNTPLWGDGIRCLGNESSLFDCRGASLDGKNTTKRGRSLKVSCGTNDVAIRLEDDGLLMMQRYGRWGTVCGSKFTNLDASVICKTLNKSSSLAAAWTGNNKPARTGTVWRDGFSCKSTDDDWRSCLYNELEDCSHDTDVYITCGELDRSSVKYRLSDGPSSDIGYLQMFVNGSWGGVCGNGYTEEARVVCRTLGKRTDGARFSSVSFSGKQIHKIWLDNVRCTGEEASILDCRHSYIGDNTCESAPGGRAFVYCGAPYNTSDFKIRLVGGSEKQPRRVEVSLFGEWGTICNNGFSDQDAQTVCDDYLDKSPFDLYTTIASVSAVGTYKEGTGKIWLTNTSCPSFESSLYGCRFALAGGSCNHSSDVGITCYKSETPDIPNTGFGYRYRYYTGAGVSGGAFFLIIGGVLSARQRRKRSAQQSPVVSSATENVVSKDDAYATQYSYSPMKN